MEPLKYRLYTLTRESVILPEEDEDISLSPPQLKAKQARKASTVSLRDDGKTKRRTSKHRLSLAQTTPQTSDALRLVRTGNLKSTDDDDHLSTFEELPDEHEDENDETAQHFTQMRLDEEQISQHLSRNKATDSKKAEKPEDGINLKPNSLEVEEQKHMTLEDKLAQDHGFDIIGIMNLSSMNLTDHDIPTIIQRAFRKKQKNFFGLILRDNALTSEGVKILVDALLTMRTDLKYLCFSDNADIGDEGIEHLTRLLQKNRSMTFLAVPNTGMTDRGVRILADTLCGVDTHSRCAPLEKLYISFNKSITDESLEAVLQIIEQNRTLKVLSLRHCSFSNKARQRLRQMGTKMKKRKFSLAE